MTKTRIATLVGVLALAAVAGVASAKRISPLSWGWYGAIQRTGNLALHGHDAVSYFSGAPLRGDSTHTVTWRGATWHFASEANRALFEAQPERYAPQFGGFCAYAASKGFTASIDPSAFRVEREKLYVFNDASARDDFIAELPAGVVARAEQQWKSRVP